MACCPISDARLDDRPEDRGAWCLGVLRGEPCWSDCRDGRPPMTWGCRRRPAEVAPEVEAPALD
jgi:hypothetical protein